MRQTTSSTTIQKTFFESQLALYGPSDAEFRAGASQRDILDLDASQDYCRVFSQRQYENFTVVSFLLPRKIRQDFYNIYAYCRWSDNLADEVDGCERSLQLLDWWQTELTACFEGIPTHPVLIALQETVQKNKLPEEPFSDLLSAFRQDQKTFRYGSHTDLLNYCERSANPVGRILLGLADATSEENVYLSDQICTGLQLANFCQDMSRDAQINRIYAPLELWDQFDVHEADILACQPIANLKAMLQEWVQITRQYFERGMPLTRSVPGWLASDVDLFVRGGLETLRLIERADYDVWTHRPTVSKLNKLRLLGSSLFGRLMGRFR